MNQFDLAEKSYYLKGIDMYRDGGTYILDFDHISFCIDNRIGTTERGTVWIGYPEKEGSEKVVNIDLLDKVNQAIVTYQARLERIKQLGKWEL